MKALLLEDDPTLSKEIQSFLLSKDIECDVVFDGELFFRQVKRQDYGIYLLDINVPKINGFDVCKQVRETNKLTPIIMLTAYGDIQDKTDAFGFGADDYLVKPFHFEELFLRITSLLRRSNKPQGTDKIIIIDDLQINTSEMLVRRKDELIDLTPKEYQLLLLLAKAKGRTLSKQSIAEQIWDVHFDSNMNTIEVYINFLRKKIDRNHATKLIHTRPGFGYYLKIED
ncbi:two component transcriptional regulator, winged helix family [Emticicia oligotrophica DSM 17448]|uniref:Two component transcriptional regulator, winged helix family n=1 Tax=Emticicia oligotrophica (strain DSM 17448 / CIP 109782 / MTCC 6937 / GPTSA100-15) TaxID=929562 RepID=A0ABM5MYZ5_EMTOG|nr:response regulator transcription factor [Emticicia oligotrophica]AFK02356.1 two component transcriptional regulator, winged helix family [Emticicia oligotrophica DSM 17448]